MMTEQWRLARLPAALALVLPLASPAFAAVDYRVQLDPQRQLLQVRACGGADGELVLAGADAAASALAGVRRNDAGRVDVAGARITAPGWSAGSCLSYTIDLAIAVDGARTGNTARNVRRNPFDAQAWLLAPDAWLWRQRPAAPARLTVDLPPGWQASLPWVASRPGGRTYALVAATGSAPARTAFGRLARRRLDLPGGQVDIAVLAPPDSDLATRLLDWQQGAAGQVLQVFGRMPVPHVQVLVLPAAGGGDPVPWAQSRRGGGVALEFHVDPAASAAMLTADWTAAHEYGHLFHPWLGPDGSWLAEGLASYLQNVLRARAGTVTVGQAWHGLHAGFGRGRAAPAGPPLEQAARRLHLEHNYMRVYWSGAAFWLEADIALRQVAPGRHSVDAALDHFARCCLPPARPWSSAAFVAELDRGLGVSILRPLFERYRARRDFPDLAGAYAALGLDPASGRPRDDAGTAALVLRTAIMARAQPAAVGPASR